ncbi:hypothetical protein B0H12DRAFT_1243085 [Mycena haematopus]|nr:hypothetical protein B0H12DRAFT_1243085 [Mycena haematopus]
MAPDKRSTRRNRLATRSGIGAQSTSPQKLRDPLNTRHFVGIGRAIKREFYADRLEALLNLGSSSDAVVMTDDWIDEPIPEPPQPRAPSPLPVPTPTPVQVFPPAPKKTAIPTYRCWEALLPRLEKPFSRYRRDTRARVQPIIPDAVSYQCRDSCDSPLALEVLCMYPTHYKMVHLTTCACMPAAILLVQHGVFPATPIRPRTAVSIDLLDLYRGLFKCSCDAITALAAAKTADGQAPRRCTTQEHRLLDDAFATAREQLSNCATLTGLSYDTVLKLFHQEEQVHPRNRNDWNLYQGFANFDDKNRLREHWRINPFCASTSPVPPLKAPELSKVYRAFVTALGGEEQASAALHAFLDMSGASDDTIRERGIASPRQLEPSASWPRDIASTTSLLISFSSEPTTTRIASSGKLSAPPELKGSVLIQEQAAVRRLWKDPDGLLKDPAPDPDPIRRSTHAPDLRAGAGARPAIDGKPDLRATAGAHTTAGACAHADAKPDPDPDAGFDSVGNAATQAAALLVVNPPSSHERGAPRQKNNKALEGEIRDDMKDGHDVRRLLALASMEDLSLDVFHHFLHNGFTWTPLGSVLVKNNLLITGYPANVRLPSEAPSNKGISSLTRPEHRWLRVAVAAHSRPGQGLRFQKYVHPNPDHAVAILSHDYTVSPPSGGPEGPASPIVNTGLLLAARQIT